MLPNQSGNATIFQLIRRSLCFGALLIGIGGCNGGDEPSLGQDGGGDASSGGRDSDPAASGGVASSGSGGNDSSSGGADPSSGGTNPSSGGADPVSGGGDSGGAETGGNTASGGAPTSGGAPASGGAPTVSDPEAKARVIVSTDGEVDDRSSMVRFLMYASDYDVIGIVQNNSIFQKDGHSDDKWVEEMLGYYDEVLPNLRVHRAGFPETDALRGLIAVGNENRDDLCRPPAEMETQDTNGSDMIIAALMDDDPRPVHVPCWGGANTVAFALYRLKQNYPDEFAAAAARLRVYGITYNLTDKAQDCGYVWIRDNMPEVKMYTAATWAGTYSYDSVDGKRGRDSKNPDEVQPYFDDPWLDANIKQGHGPLGAYYPQSYTSEGDTPSFLPLIDNGLLGHVDYTYGGWGGRAMVASGNHMIDADNENGDPWAAVYRWSIAAQNDWAARADWCVTSEFSGANHNPIAQVQGGTRRTGQAGATVTLDASNTTDPDGDELSFHWWQYSEADSAETELILQNSDQASGVQFTIPDEPGKQLHVILGVTDDGTPPLTHYARVILDIEE